MIKKSHLWAVYNGTLTPSLLIEGSKGTFKIVAANNTFCQLSELDEDSISGLKPTEVIRIFANYTKINLTHELEDSLDFVATNKQPHEMQFQQVLRPFDEGFNKRKIGWRLINTPILGEGNDLLFIIMAFVEVNQHIVYPEQEKAIVSDQQIYKGLFENYPDSIFISNAEGRITSCNKKFISALDFSMEEIKLLTLYDLVSNDEKIIIKRMIEKCLKMETVIFQSTFISKKKRKMVYEVMIMPLVRQEKTVGVYGILIDKTQEKIQEQNVLRKCIHLQTISNVSRLLVQENGGTDVFKNVFALLGKVLSIDIISFYRFEDKFREPSLQLLSSWENTENISPKNLPEFTFDDFHSCFPNLEKNKIFKSKLKDLKKNSLRDRLKSRDTHSYLIHPLFYNQKLWGCIMMEDSLRERAWSLDDVTLINTIVFNLSLYMDRYIINKTITESHY